MWGALSVALPTLYLTLTMPRGLMWFDAGELATACATWGLGHPPGQPLYTLVGALAHALGGLTGVNLLSALSIVGALMAQRARYQLHNSRRGGAPLELSELLLGLTWVSLYPVWDQGARVELYGFASALGFWALYALERALGALDERSPKVSKSAWWAGLALGGCGASNAIFAVAFGLSGLWRTLSHPALAHAWCVQGGVGRTRLWLALRALSVGALIGLIVPYLYLVWAALGSEGFVWGELTSSKGLLAYLSGADYRGTAHASWSLAPTHALTWLAWALPLGLLIPWIFLAGGAVAEGGVRALKAPGTLLKEAPGTSSCTSRKAPGTLLKEAPGTSSCTSRKAPGTSSCTSILRALWALPLIVVCALFPLTYERYWPEVPDFTGYLLPVLTLTLLPMWRLSARLYESLTAEGEGSQWRKWLTPLLCALLLSVNLVTLRAPHSQARSTHSAPLTLAQDWLESLPPNSLLLVSSDHWVFPLLYAQEALKRRPDVVVFNVGFERSGWYWRWLRVKKPRLDRGEERGARRLEALAASWPGPIYTERLGLGARLSLARTQQPLTVGAPPPAPCPASWGVSVGCERPLPPPNAKELRALAREQAPLSPITERVFASHAAQLALNHWSAGEARLALELGYAALGLDPPPHAPAARWWPAPPALWAQEGLLIGEPEVSLAILEALGGR